MSMTNPPARAICLAVILLLLTGGVAVAQLALTIEPDCIECCPLSEIGPCPDYTARVTSTGWNAYEWLNLTLTGPGSAGPYWAWGFFSADGTGAFEIQIALMCERPRGLEGEVSTHSGWGNYWWVYPDWQLGDYGEWMIEISGESGSGSVEGDFLFAEDCSLLEEEEFVPEPGAIILLGSGLVGLAGYAGLRLRGHKV